MTEPPRTPDDLRMQAEVRDDSLYPRPQPPASEREAALRTVIDAAWAVVRHPYDKSQFPALRRALEAIPAALPAATPSPDAATDTPQETTEEAHDRLSPGPHRTGNCRFCDERGTALPAPSPDAGEPPTLDAAWREAEAALPAGWLIYELSQLVVPHGDANDEYLDDEWRATASLRWELGDYRAAIGQGTGPTPAAALHALRAALSRSPESGT